jgi:hypothetical protein
MRALWHLRSIYHQDNLSVIIRPQLPLIHPPRRCASMSHRTTYLPTQFNASTAQHKGYVGGSGWVGGTGSSAKSVSEMRVVDGSCRVGLGA